MAESLPLWHVSERSLWLEARAVGVSLKTAADIDRVLAVGLQSLVLAALVWALCRYLPRLDARTRARLVSLAKWKAGDTAIKVANEAVQMHGGIGVTDELDVGLFLKRIRVAQACLGDADFHCERYASLAFAPA